MARALRIQFPGAYDHVMARGNPREAIFLDDDDRRFFLKALGEACGMTGWRVHAWVLMGSHYHLFIETPEANLVHGMSWLQNTVTRRHNLRHGLWGRMFGDRYKAVPVEGADGVRYRRLCDYIHLNPVRARMIRPDRGQSVLDYPWSSLAGGYSLPPGKRPKWMVAGEGLRRMELPDSAAGRRRLVERLDRRAVEEDFKRCGIPAGEADVDEPAAPPSGQGQGGEAAHPTDEGLPEVRPGGVVVDRQMAACQDLSPDPLFPFLLFPSRPRRR